MLWLGVDSGGNCSAPVEEDRGSGSGHHDLRVPWDALGERVSLSWSSYRRGSITIQWTKSQWHHCTPPLFKHRDRVQPGLGLFAVLYSKFQAPICWCNCLSGTNWHQPQHGKTLTQRTSVSLPQARSLKFGVLKCSQHAWDKTQNTALPGRQRALTQTGWRQESKGFLEHMRGDCSLFCEGFLDSTWHKLLSSGIQKRAGTIFLHYHQHELTSVSR